MTPLQHKPNCSTNMRCAVYHADGICPGYKSCDCGFLPQQKIDNSGWEERFDHKFSYASFTWNGDNFTGKKMAQKMKRMVKNFIRQELATTRKQALKEFAEAVRWKEIESTELCSATCATQAPEDFSAYGCTCGGNNDVVLYNEIGSELNTKIDNYLKDL